MRGRLGVQGLGNHFHSFWLLDCAVSSFAAWIALAQLPRAVNTVAIRIVENSTYVGFGSDHFVSHLLLALLTAG